MLNCIILKYTKGVYNNLLGFIKEIDDYKAFKKELKLFLLHHSFHSVEEFVSPCDPPMILI